MIINNGNTTEWNTITIQEVIDWIISKHLKFWAQLLPELYDTKSYYQLIVKFYYKIWEDGSDKIL